MGLTLEGFRSAVGVAGTACGVTRVLKSLSESDQKVLTAALADATIQHSAIERVMKAEGHRLPALTIGRHRRGECSCGR